MLTEEQMQTLYDAINERNNAIDKVVTLYNRHYLAASELCEKILKIIAEYDLKTAEIFANAE